MKILLYASLIFFIATQVLASEFYVSPLNVGMLSGARSSGEPGNQSSVTVGAEGYYLYKNLMFGLKYDHIDNGTEGNSVVSVRNQLDILSLQVGMRVLTSAVSPYFFVGEGAFFQTVDTTVFNSEEKNFSTTMGYNLGIGVLAQFTDRWAANVSVHYYPQDFISGFNYMISAGYLF